LSPAVWGRQGRFPVAFLAANVAFSGQVCILSLFGDIFNCLKNKKKLLFFWFCVAIWRRMIKAVH